MRHAVIDIGTHSTRLLVVDSHEDVVTELHRSAIVTKLGAGVDKNRILSDDGVRRTLDVVERFGAICRDLNVVSGKAVATSALRDAFNGDEFLSDVSRLSGLTATTIDGQQEASYSFAGAVAGIPDLAPTTEVVMADIGGGSTEIVHGGLLGVKESVSLDIGCLRLTERFITSDVPDREQRDALFDYAIHQLSDRAPYISSDVLMIGVAGTVTTLFAMANEIDPYVPKLVNHGLLSADDIEEVIAATSSVGLEERRKLKGLQSGRADVIVAGSLIALAILRYAGKTEMMVSESDLLDGIVGELIA